MTAFLSVVILLLLIVILWQYLRLRGHSRQLDYIHTKLTSIVDRGSHERLLLFNSNPHLQTLLTDLNRSCWTSITRERSSWPSWRSLCAACWRTSLTI